MDEGMNKICTDIPQSKKLAKILRIETADMCLNISQWHNNMPPLMTPYSKFNEFFNMETPDFLIPCWSLSALFEVLPKYIGDYGKCLYYDIGGYYCGYMVDGKFMLSVGETTADNPIDAVFEMIIKLNELQLL